MYFQEVYLEYTTSILWARTKHGPGVYGPPPPTKNVIIRDLLQKVDKTLHKKRSNDPECPFFQFLPKEKNMRYNLRNTSVSVPRIYTDRFKNVFSNRIIFRYDM